MLWHCCKKKLFILHILLILLALVWIFKSNSLGFNCIIKSIFRIECPTCGMSRAIKYLMLGNLKLYSYYNIFALPVVIAVWLEIHHILFSNKFAIHTISMCILILNFIYYIFRIVSF